MCSNVYRTGTIMYMYCIRVEHEFIDYCIHLFPIAYLAQIRLALVLILYFLRYEMVATIVFGIYEAVCHYSIFERIQNVHDDYDETMN